MEEQKEALRRIVTAVESKYFEAQAFSSDIENDIRSLTEQHENAIMELNSQFQALTEALERSKFKLTSEIKESRKSKQTMLENRLKTFTDAENDTEDLLDVAKHALAQEDDLSFAQIALQIKDRVTMSPLFRLSLTPLNVETECHLLADFEREIRLINNLKFLPIPEVPIIVESGCFAEDNIVRCAWKMPTDDMVVCEEEYGLISNAADASLMSHVGQNFEHFLLQYRQVEKDENLINKPWISIENVSSLTYSIPGLIFDQEYVQFRVQAWNKGLGGPFSTTHLISTPAFNFSLDQDASHANLKVISESVVEWDTTATKTQDVRIRSASGQRTPSPALKSMSPRRSRTKDRFTGESFTVLGDTSLPDKSESYFEVTPHVDCKTYTIGVAASNIGRFDQVGKNNFSWGIHVSSWMQNSFVAKHNNKVKNLDGKGSPPRRYGVFISTDTGILSFYDADNQQCLHTFKLIKKFNLLYPAFLIWFGSLQVHTGLQVPSWVVTRPESTQPKSSSPSLSPEGNSTVD